ncbi:hypothetical protein N7478_009219 [Penicillium angulare]|uniref:uncharacterized protein n=1 Tax=Penicillium angulare TaxID=116970 RepID=UPI002540A0BD|nr:uncharacterized protein N7478_009219 [Penicillium angulare]KAJ5274094.1 hypothetical protein N7478_009219 [Penicillium angulare]
MSDLLSSRWAPSASESASYPSRSRSLRRPRSENRIRSTATPSPTNNKNEYKYTNTNTKTNTYGNQRGGPGSGTPLAPAEELSRFMKIVARLRWKLPFLAEGYRRATLTVDGVITSAEEVAHSEIMFKIDFHEYYALLERAIVHLLAVFNISVSSVGGRSGSGSGSGVQVGGGSGSAGVHRFHANVLQALQEESTPLAPVLGTGHVHELLKKAKELRNRWKAADMTDEERERDPFEMGRRVLPLASFDFDEILTGVFNGLEKAYIRAQAHVDLCKKPGEEEKTDAESDWGFMVDAMDWEAV